jgi:hypothetical protein
MIRTALWATLALLLGLTVTHAIAEADAGATATNTRYFGGLLDSRSRYGQYWFPEPLRAPEMDVDNEFRVDWVHTENGNSQADEVKAEIEKSFGLLTLEVEVAYEREAESGIDPDTGLPFRDRSEGIGAIEFSARHPICQWVSADERFDFTLAPALEVAIPSGSDISKDSELVPQLFGLLRVGEHFSLQTSVGYSFVIGPEESGNQTLEYSAVFGWAFEQGERPLPSFVQRVVPIVEVVGERGLNQGNFTNILTGTAGFRINFESIGALQPRLGLGYVFPIDEGGRDELDWGVVTSLVFEF